jgi:hypothetical protein
MPLQIPSKPLAATAVVAVGALWIIMAAALIWATEFLQGEATKCAPPLFSPLEKKQHGLRFAGLLLGRA